MNSAAYTKGVFATLSRKPAKDGLRLMAKKTKTLDAGHAILGVVSEVGEILKAMRPFMMGAPLSQEMLDEAREEWGDLLYYLHVARRVLRIKTPSSTKKVALKGTVLGALLDLGEASTHLADTYKKTYYGRPLDLDRAKSLFETVFAIVWPLVYKLYKETPSVFMEENNQKLLSSDKARYKSGEFSTEQAEARADKDGEPSSVGDPS